MAHPHGRRRLRRADGRREREDILDLYAEPYDPAYPTVCLDEKPVVLHDQTRTPLPPKPGAVERRDYEYVPEGTADPLVMVEPLAGWRHVVVTERRTRRDFAECLRYLVEERYPHRRVCAARRG